MRRPRQCPRELCTRNGKGDKAERIIWTVAIWRERASLLCPIRWRKEPYDGQQRNEDQNAHREVIDYVRKTSCPSASGQKPSGMRPNPKAAVSATPVVMTKARAQIIFFMAVPLFLVVLGLPEKCKEISDRHHVLELFEPSAAPSE